MIQAILTAFFLLLLSVGCPGCEAPQLAAAPAPTEQYDRCAGQYRYCGYDCRPVCICSSYGGQCTLECICSRP